MRYSLAWLRDFVETDMPVDRLAARLTVAGFEVGGWETFRDAEDPSAPADTVLEIDVTANRPDAMNHYGMAREIGAILGVPLRAPEFPLLEASATAASAASVAIVAGDLCPRYVGRAVSGVRIGASPSWLARRLRAIGLLPKNAVVDASNYVLFELGQPLHAFDLGTLEGRGVVVRRAREGESLVTVTDRERRTLSEGMLVIGAAGRKGQPGPPAAIAGVMGGAETAISETTTDILIESAWFDPLSVRRTARALSLHTDASHRFERGADPGMTLFAADRLASLIVEVAGGQVLAGALDVRAGEGLKWKFEGGDDDGAPSAVGHARRFVLLRRSDPLRLRTGRVASFLGVQADAARIASVLAPLGIDARRARGSDEESACYIPTWRGDLTGEADLIEEYARLIGYEAVPETLPPALPVPIPDAKAEAEDLARERLAAAGYHEVITYAMLPRSDDALFGPLPGCPAAPTITNPLSDRWEIMRRSLLPGLGRTLAYNLARGRQDMRVFEVASVHGSSAGAGQPSPIEIRAAAIGLTGLAGGAAWPAPSRHVDVLDLKGALETLVDTLMGSGRLASMGELVFTPLPPGSDLVPAPFHPGQSFLVWRDGQCIGRGGRISRAAELALEVDRPLFVAEIAIDPFLSDRSSVAFEPLPRLNPVERDLSFFVDRSTPYAEIARVVGQGAAALASSSTGTPSSVLIDRFDADPSGRVSYAFRFRFTQSERPLTADELNGAIETIAARIESELGAQVRSR